MNSKQVNFFLTAADQAELLRRFVTKSEFVVLASVTEGGRLHLLESAEVKEMGRDRLTVYLARPGDLHAVKLQSLQHQIYKTIDIVKSPLVEFARCYHADGLLRRGRLYF